MKNKKVDYLDQHLGFAQPRSVLRLSDDSGEFWTSTALEFADSNFCFDKKMLQKMENLKHAFVPSDFFSSKLPMEDLLLLWIEFERCHADDSLIMFLILAFKLRVLNPSRNLSREQLHDLMLECASMASEQVLHPYDIAQQNGTTAYRPAGVTFVIKNSNLPPVTKLT